MIKMKEKFLFQSIENTQDLYLLLLSALTEIKRKEEQYIELASKKHLATKEERNPNLKFVQNKVLVLLSESESLQDALDNNKINNWKLNNWKNSNKKDVKNKDLWTKLDSLINKKQISWEWVKAHSINEYNNKVDILARKAASAND